MSIKQSFNNYKRKRSAAIIYYRKLVKASLLISIVPIVVVAIMVVYSRLTFLEGLLGGVAVFFGSTFFAKPYLDDLTSLTYYVEQLALNRNAPAPELSLLGNVEELSKSVSNLHNSWGNRNIELEAALAESSILFDTIPDILLMLDKNLNIVRANNAAVHSFHMNMANLQFSELMPEKELVNAIREVIETGRQQSVETAFPMHHGKYDYLVMIEKFPVRSISNVEVVLVMHNITESKKVKQMLKDFVANASHEIRTPLTSVNGFIENLIAMEHDKNPDVSKTRDKFLHIMSDQTDRMVHLVNDLLSLSKVEMNEDIAPDEVVDLAQILNSTRKRLKWLADESNIKISISGAKKSPKIVGDYNELSQVFTNIISNAIKYGKAHSTVKIDVATTKDFSKSKYLPRNCDEVVIISVSDRGEGIAQEHISRITERFYRVDKARSRKIGGTGLGLAIAKHILNRHRGDLLIQSKLGQGSVFTVRLPLGGKKKEA